MYKKVTLFKGRNFAQLDPTRFASNVGESKSLLISAQATAARLRAEVNGTPFFPEIVMKEPKLVQEKLLYIARVVIFEQTPAGLRQALQLVQQELAMTEPLVAKCSEVEVSHVVKQMICKTK